jgi:tetratricopeptide (TPR) repeat protein
MEGVDLADVLSVSTHFQAALLDCDAALDLQPNSVKALFRKAQALRGMGRGEEAVEVASSALRTCSHPHDATCIAAFVALCRCRSSHSGALES